MAALLAPQAAYATPPVGVSGQNITKVTALGTEYIVRQITIAPGGSTGWHWHNGTLYVRVVRGTLTHTTYDCVTTRNYGAGRNFVEPSGSRFVHIGRNLGETPVVLQVLYVNPQGAPLAQDVPNPGCPFQ
ncbi:cupin domain-containing protein [Microtetraspora sp. NBRC 13810]|uniref:cupin domain-containing protein n=1 Tax=Microtetraspora sp. NBRC 13810 TaxID=3030990 RepID=UPI0025539D07|nr:cupin domain-containing protein [Microtetraspora sp. NBRC 13810]